MKEDVQQEHSHEAESMQLQSAESSSASAPPPPFQLTADPVQLQEAPAPVQDA